MNELCWPMKLAVVPGVEVDGWEPETVLLLSTPPESVRVLRLRSPFGERVEIRPSVFDPDAG